jgi:hypothetical protein
VKAIETLVISLEGSCACCCFNVHSDKWPCICPFKGKREFRLSERRFRRGCRHNPADDPEIHQLKQTAADLIDFCQTIPILAER